MNLPLTIDRYTSKNVIPLLKQEYFKSKIISVASIAYISAFPRARKFIMHYFSGKGSVLSVSSMDVILKNPAVYDTIIKVIGSMDNSELSGSIHIGQHLVHHPEYRYSLGSFTLHYSVDRDLLVLSVGTNYNFDLENDRLTKYLHRWLFSFEESGRAASFNIEGEEWRTSIDEFTSLNPGSKMRKYMNFNILYV